MSRSNLVAAAAVLVFAGAAHAVTFSGHSGEYREIAPGQYLRDFQPTQYQPLGSVTFMPPKVAELRKVTYVGRSAAGSSVLRADLAASVAARKRAISSAPLADQQRLALASLRAGPRAWSGATRVREASEPASFVNVEVDREGRPHAVGAGPAGGSTGGVGALKSALKDSLQARKAALRGAATASPSTASARADALKADVLARKQSLAPKNTFVAQKRTLGPPPPRTVVVTVPSTYLAAWR